MTNRFDISYVPEYLLDDENTANVSESTETPCSIKISMANLCYMYASAYHAGHHDTVEGRYTDVYPCDMDTYHEETVTEFLEELKE